MICFSGLPKCCWPEAGTAWEVVGGWLRLALYSLPLGSGLPCAARSVAGGSSESGRALRRKQVSCSTLVLAFLFCPSAQSWF